MCHGPFSGQKVSGQGHIGGLKFLLGPLFGSVRIRPNRFICGTNIHGVTMCCAPFPGQKVKGQCHMGRSKFLPCPLLGSMPFSPIYFICCTNTTCEGTTCHTPFPGQKSWSYGSFLFLRYSTLGSVAIWPIHFIWGDAVSHIIPRSKGQRSKSFIKNVGLWWLRTAAAVISLDLLA